MQNVERRIKRKEQKWKNLGKSRKMRWKKK